jgi:carbonic anhydrase
LTIASIIATNLLLGVVIGLVISLLFILGSHSHSCFTIFHEKRPSGEVQRLRLPQQATFLSRAAIIESLNQIPPHSKVILDARFTDYIDEDILGVLKDAQKTLEDKGILVNLEGFKEKYNIETQDNFIDVTTYDVQNSLTPDQILSLFKEGNKRFVQNMPVYKNYKKELTATSQSQHPLAVVLSCIDSRVPIELIFDLSLGDVFVSRIAGNVADVNVLASIEYACHVAGAKLIIVLGHKSCGAVQVACSHLQHPEKDQPLPEEEHIYQLLEKIKPALEKELQKKEKRTEERFLTDVIISHVLLTKEEIYERSPVLRHLIDSKKVKLVGAFYDLETGEVNFELEKGRS